MKTTFNFITALYFVFFTLNTIAQQTAKPESSQSAVQIQSLLEKLGSDDELVRFESGKSLIKIGQEAVPLLNEAINKNKGYLRVEAAQVLRVIEPDNQAAPQTLGSIAGDTQEKPEVRRYAVYTLALSPSGVPLLITMLENEDVFVRRSATFALNELFDISGTLAPQYTPSLTNAIPSQIAALGDPDETVSQIAVETLLTLRGDIDFLFDAAQKSPNQKLRQTAQAVKEARQNGKSVFGQQMKMSMKPGAEDQIKGNKEFLNGRLGIIYALAIGDGPVKDFRSIPQNNNLGVRITLNLQTRQASSGLSRLNPYQDLQ